MPDDLPRLRALRILFCSSNPFETLPAVLGRCDELDIVGFKANAIAHVPAEALPPSLRWLILSDNRVDALPETLGALPPPAEARAGRQPAGGAAGGHRALRARWS